MREFQKNIYFCFIDYAKAVDCVDHNKLWKILKEMGIPDHLTCLLRNLYAGQEAIVRTGHGTTDWHQIGKGVHQGSMFSSVQSFSRVRLFVTPWTAACQASLSITNSWSLLKLMPIKLAMPYNHLILCDSLLLLPSLFPYTTLFRSSQSYGFSSGHVWMWELDYKESWAQKNDAFELWCWRRLLRVPWTARRSN